jgi:hypothetical protein
MLLQSPGLSLPNLGVARLLSLFEARTKFSANIAAINDVRPICQLANTLLLLSSAAEWAFHWKSPNRGRCVGIHVRLKLCVLVAPCAIMHFF